MWMLHFSQPIHSPAQISLRQTFFFFNHIQIYRSDTKFGELPLTMIFPFPSDPILFHLLKMFQWQPSKSISQPLIGFEKKGDLDYYFTWIPPFSASQTLLVLS